MATKLISSAWLAQAVADARRRTFALVADLDDAQLFGPRLAIVNPLHWEIGHLAWFQEHWVLRDGGTRPSLRSDADSLYDSMAVAHDTRWDLPLPSREATLEYLVAVRDGVLRLLESEPDARQKYFVMLSVLHEDMHDEAFIAGRQVLGYPAPRFREEERLPAQSGHHGSEEAAAEPSLIAIPDRMSHGSREANSRRAPGPPQDPETDKAAAVEESAPDSTISGDVEIAGGPFALGASPHEPFVFDNEKWEHTVMLRPFAIARTPVTQSEFAEFVEDGGYRRRELWSEAGWRWRTEAAAEHPVYWKRETPGDGWLRREFDRWTPLEPRHPVIHVNWYEAEAWCRWARRRLPTEAEWERAACGPGPLIGNFKRRYPWGDDPAPGPALANLDASSSGSIAVTALAAGDAPEGLRQMIGNVWEWTASDFLPYPGFVADPYRDYSVPWFGNHKVLRGGCWVTRARLIRATWRNFYEPHRRDPFAGFRTCALKEP